MCCERLLRTGAGRRYALTALGTIKMSKVFKVLILKRSTP